MITGVILTHNEEHNIVKCIEHLRPHVSEIILIDTSSDDRTVELATPLVDKVLLHPHVEQFDAVRNIAIPVSKNEWLWFVDADEFIPTLTGQKVNQLLVEQGTTFDALTIPFKTYFCGQWMQHSGWWPGYTGPRVLKRGSFQFSESLHGGVILNGREVLAPPFPELGIDHYSYRDLSHWVTKSNRYTSVEAKQLRERGIEYDWRRSVEAMIRELWRVYERCNAKQDGERGWILAVCHAFYGWLSQAKLVDLGASSEQEGMEASVPADLGEFLRCVEDTLAVCRKDDVQTPIGILVRAPIREHSRLAHEARQCLEKLDQVGRQLVIDDCSSVHSADLSPNQVRLLRALANGKRPRCLVAITFSEHRIRHADAGAWYNVLRLSSVVDLEASAPSFAGYDAIFVDSESAKVQLTIAGISPEKLKILPAKSNEQECGTAISEFVEQLIQETEFCLSATLGSICDESKIQVAIEGEFFAGHSFSNINEQIASDLIRDGRFCLSLKQAASESPKNGNLRNPLARRLYPYFGKPVDSRHIVIKHAWPPDWSCVEGAIWVHIQPWEYSRLPADWVGPLQQQVDEIWVMSRFVQKAYIESGIDPGKIHYVPWGFDPEVFRLGLAKRSLATARSFKFLFVGGTISRKGFDTLLSAYLQEFTASDDVVLVVKDHPIYVQESMRAEILDSLRDPLSAKLIYLDEDYSPGQLASLYSACNCLVAPYRGEGFALPVLEAMACGCVPLVPSGGATDDFVRDNFGYFVPSSFTEFQGDDRLCESGTEIYISVTNLRTSLRRVLDDAKSTRQKGILASEYAHQHFTWKHANEKMVERLQMLGERHKLTAIDDRAHNCDEVTSSVTHAHAIDAQIEQSSFSVGSGPANALVSAGTDALKQESPRISNSKYGRLKKSVLIQLAVGKHVELLELTQNHHRKYAARHNLDYLQMIGNPACQKRPGWGKVPMILSAIEMGYERIVWLDADAVIVQVDVDLTQTIDAGLGLVRHPRPNHWNTGVIVVHASRETERFWKRVDGYAENDSDWMEQLAVNELLRLQQNRTLARAIDLKYNSVPGVAAVSHPVVIAGHGLDFASRRSILEHGLKTSANSGNEKRIVLSSRENFPELLNSLSLTGEAVEVGVLKGEFSENLLSRWEGKVLHAVDAWRSLPGYTDIANVSNEEHEANRLDAMNRLARFGSRCQIHRMHSAEAASRFENGSLDFVYLDADHSFESVWQDLSVWYPKVRIGGILAGHDFLDGELPEGNFGVESAVRMFQQIHQFELRKTNDPPWRSWYFAKSK